MKKPSEQSRNWRDRLSINMLQRHIEDQKQWIEDHGGNLRAYLDRYGSDDDLDKIGDGGLAIYLADTEALRLLQEALERKLERKLQRQHLRQVRANGATATPS